MLLSSVLEIEKGSVRFLFQLNVFALFKQPRSSLSNIFFDSLNSEIEKQYINPAEISISNPHLLIPRIL